MSSGAIAVIVLYLAFGFCVCVSAWRRSKTKDDHKMWEGFGTSLFCTCFWLLFFLIVIPLAPVIIIIVGSIKRHLKGRSHDN